MSVDPTDPTFHDEDSARAYCKAKRWPARRLFCPHCGSVNVHRLEGKSHRDVLIQCNDRLAICCSDRGVVSAIGIPSTGCVQPWAYTTYNTLCH